MHPMISQHQIITSIYPRLIPGYQTLGLLIHGPWSPQMGLENLSKCKEWRCTVFDDLTSLMGFLICIWGRWVGTTLLWSRKIWVCVEFWYTQEFHGLQHFPHINIAHFDGLEWVSPTGAGSAPGALQNHVQSADVDVVNEHHQHLGSRGGGGH